VPLGILIANVVSVSTSLGALAALAVLAVHLRSRGVALLLAAVVFLTADYVLGLTLALLPDSPLWRGLAGLPTAGRWASVVFGLKGICHVGILLTGPLAILLLFGRNPSRPVRWAFAVLGAAFLAAMGLLIAGSFPREPLAVYAVTAVPAYAAYVICMLLLVRLRSSAQGLGRAVVRAAIVALSVFIPALFVADFLGISGRAPRMLPIDPVAFFVLSTGILVCSLLVIIGPRRRLAAGDVDAYCAAHDLSIREREVLLLLGEGLRYKQIAVRLAISPDTVKTHVSRIYRKTSAAGKTDLFYRIRLGRG
jgi:DNA-binding CsgD family transcriptional regulator